MIHNNQFCPPYPECIENFIGYQAKDHHTEAGYSMLTGFEADASKAVLDLTGNFRKFVT